MMWTNILDHLKLATSLVSSLYPALCHIWLLQSHFSLSPNLFCPDSSWPSSKWGERAGSLLSLAAGHSTLYPGLMSTSRGAITCLQYIFPRCFYVQYPCPGVCMDIKPALGVSMCSTHALGVPVCDWGMASVKTISTTTRRNLHSCPASTPPGEAQRYVQINVMFSVVLHINHIIRIFLHLPLKCT